MPDKKRKRLTHEQQARKEELEGRLFGNASIELSRFGAEDEENASLPFPAAAVGADAQPLIWEDRRGDGVDLAASDASSEGDSDASSEEGSDAADVVSGDASERVSEDDAAADVGVSSEEARETQRASEDEASTDASSEDGSDGPSASEASGEGRTEGKAGGSDWLQEASGDDYEPGEEQHTTAAERRSSGRSAGPSAAPKPVWHDAQEEALLVNLDAKSRTKKLRVEGTKNLVSGVEYARRLQKQHAKLNPRTSWADVSKAQRKAAVAEFSDDDIEEAEALERIRQGASNLLTGGSLLPAGLLEATRLRNANLEEPSQAVVQSVEFHPGGQLLMTAGLDKRLRFFQVDGVKNAKVQSVYLQDLPIHKAAFVAGGSKVIASGRRKHFYVLDLEAAKVQRVASLTASHLKSHENFAVSPGTDQPLIAFLGARGFISLVSSRSSQLLATLKMPATVHSAAFTDDGTYLSASGGDGIVHTWDMRTRQCLSRFVDEGTRRGLSIASSPGQKFLATGSDAGFVNLYDYRRAIEAGTNLSSAPSKAATVSPLKALKNLTTAADTLAFSPDGQILAMSSKEKKDALRLVHTSTMTVFSNWPTARSPLHFVNSMAFSPNGGFFAIGNAKGHALLYRLHHYSRV